MDWKVIETIALAAIAAVVTLGTAYIAARWRISTKSKSDNSDDSEVKKDD